jgi:hypothetical protein
MPLLGRFRPSGARSGGAAAPKLRRRAPSPGGLRRERRAILRAREELIRDVGGLALEMYRRDKFREDLLAERCRDIVDLELRLSELDSMLEAAAAGRHAAGRCECGAPILWGSHFCGNCGRPVGAEPVVACRSCGHPLPADAQFCPSCGTSAEQDEAEAGDAAAEADATVVRPAAGASSWEN